jgi:hypothetical protein
LRDEAARRSGSGLVKDADEELLALRRVLDMAGVEASEVVAPHDGQVILGGMRLHYLDWGGPGRSSVVLLHGGGLTAHTYDLICLALRDTYRCFAPDLRGHGDSE